MTLGEREKNKKEQRKARKALTAFLKELKKMHDAYGKIKDINEKINTLRSILTEYEKYLPPEVRTQLENAMQFTDTSPDGIKNTLEALKIAVEDATNILPAPVVSATVAAIGISVTVVTVAVTAYLTLMGSLYVTNEGCQIISAVQQWTPIPSIAAGETKKIPVPKIQVNIVSTTNEITLSSQFGTVPIPLPDHVINIQFDGKSILGTSVPVNFGDGVDHNLIITCTR